VAKAWVVDRWQKVDGTSGRKTKTAQHGAGSRWRVDWYEDQANGTKRLRSRSFKNKAGEGGAEEFATATDSSMRSGAYSPAENGRRPFGDVAREYLESKKSIKDSHRYRLERDLRTWINPKWEFRGVGSIKRSELEAWVGELQSGRAPHSYASETLLPSPDGLSASSIKGIVVLAGSVFKYAMRHGLIQSNPADGVERPRVVKKPLVILDHVEVERLADSAFRVQENPTDRALVLILSYVGLRINEALALDVASVNLAARRATISRTWSQGSSRELGSPKTGETRSVSLPSFLIAELRPLLDGQPGDAFVFRAARGGDIHDTNWRNRVWAKAVAAADLGTKKPTPHDLRHAAASMMIASGADVKVIQSQLGHARATETLDTYGFLWPDRLDIVSDAVEIARRDALEGAAAISHHD
jgi:integrase